MLIKILICACELFSSRSSPEQVVYSGEIRGESAIKSENDIGPAVNHTYEVSNR